MLILKARTSSIAILSSVAVAGLFLLGANGGSSDRTLQGEAVKVGDGTARLYVEVTSKGEPRAVGVALSAGAMQGLPEKMNNTSRCFDKNKDGNLSHGECIGDYQSTLKMPNAAKNLSLPVRYATVNWNPEGHMHPAPPVWGAAHFDFHFFLVEPELINGIRPGGCAEIIDCDDFAKAQIPLPAQQQPADHIDVGAAVAAMGNHLVDSKDPEIADPSLGFSKTFIFGAFDGRMIFLEPMVSHKYLSTRPDACTPVKQPKAWATTDYYPTRYCVRFDAASATYRVSLEGLVRGTLASN